MKQPLISIVTPCLNRAAFVREAIESVLAQNYSNFEHIVIDGGSIDGTLDILRSFSHLRVISEPDEGMYDAINKGIRLAQGDIIGLLNTDDLYATGCFDAVVATFEGNPSALAVDGGITTFEDGETERVTVGVDPAIEPERFWERLIEGSPVTNAWFYRPTLFKQIGFFDTNYRYSADRFFLIRLALDGQVRPVPIHKPLYHYRQHSESATITTLDSRTPHYGRLRMNILQEDICGLDDFLDRPTLPAGVRRIMRREHGVRCYRLAATALYHHQGKLLVRAVMQGWRRNPLWPMVFVRLGLGRIRKELNSYE
jgi:glycosyltransferase involved in cell wall biosynthesis